MASPGHLTVLIIVATLASMGCTTFHDRPAPHKPVQFDAAATPGGEKFPNWPMPPATTWDALLSEEGLKHVVRERKSAGAGTTGAMKEQVYFPELGRDVPFKVKKIPRRLDGINNAPRKELAAYNIQFLFLDPEDFVVPTTMVYCAPLAQWHEGDKDRKQHKTNLKGANCMFIVAALWLKDLRVPEVLYDEARFLKDPTYAYYLSNLNLFTYLVKHQDARRGNFLTSTDDTRRQVFTIDNGSTFNQPLHNFFVPNWNLIRVAALRQDSIDRLRKLKRGDLDPLLVVAQVAFEEDGSVVQVKPGASLDDSKGAVREGDTIQFGLTKKEIDDVWDRIQKLIAQVDDGSLPVF